MKNSQPARHGMRRRVVILGAGGRDFHNFNMVYRDDPGSEVLAFGATQIPGIGNRHYPPELAGELYPGGIPILAESDLFELCRHEDVDQAVFAYSDVRHEDVMHTAARFQAMGCDFVCLGPRATMLRAPCPVIAVTAVRTGCGKSPVSRAILGRLRRRGLRVGVIRHPMPYGDLARQRSQRFAAAADLDAAKCTIEEREEYEPFIEGGGIVYAGVDYAAILAEAARDADLLLWDGGNNDFPFIVPDLSIVLTDALRPGHETAFHPGETCLRMADCVVVMKVAEAGPEATASVERNARAANAKAPIFLGDLDVVCDGAGEIRGRCVLVVEDGPTLTHGGMASGAGMLAAREAGAAEIIDPRPFAAPELAETYERFPHIGAVLPAVGYSDDQLRGLGRTIAAAAPDVVVIATPVALDRLIAIDAPVVRVSYSYRDRRQPGLMNEVERFCDHAGFRDTDNGDEGRR